MEESLKFAIFGCGFWSQFQLGAWTEIEGATCVALYNRTLSKAKKLADRFHVPRVYDDAVELLKNEELDFVDIITDVDTHAYFVELAIQYGIKNIICQKPMAPNFEMAKQMMDMTKAGGVNFYIHENYRWEMPIRRFKELMDARVIGNIFKARISFLSNYPVFENQPFLADLSHFILTDMGSHVLDVARFLFGECQKLWCLTKTINPDIKGEDLASIMMEMKNGMQVFTEISYASIVEHDSFTTLFILAEGDKGSIYLGPGFEIRITTKEGTTVEKVGFPNYPWADPDYIVNHASGVPINQNILDDIRGRTQAENTGADNFETVKLVWASYQSASSGDLINMDLFQ